MKKIKFSVIIPAHNEEDLIGRAVKSVLNQTFKDFEVIISNDGSTDKTKEIIGKIMKKDKRVKIINRKKGHSAAFARNRGAEKAKGKVFVFLDADCTISRNFLEKINQKLDKGDGFAVDCFAITNSIVNYALSGLTIPIVMKKEIYSKKDYDAPMLFTITKKAYNKIKGYDENIFYFEDENFAKRFYAKEFKSVFVRGAKQYFELPSTFKEFLRQCQWIAKGTNSLKNPQIRKRKRTLWFLKSLFLISPLLFLIFSYQAFLWVLVITLGVTYLNLVKRNKNPIKSVFSLIFLYIKTFYVSIRLLKKKS